VLICVAVSMSNQYFADLQYSVLKQQCPLQDLNLRLAVGPAPIGVKNGAMVAPKIIRKGSRIQN
jgi:hypothetical protein